MVQRFLGGDSLIGIVPGRDTYISNRQEYICIKFYYRGVVYICWLDVISPYKYISAYLHISYIHTSTHTHTHTHTHIHIYIDISPYSSVIY